MWVILPNNADWDCFKTLTSREILKIRNPLLEEHCAFSEAIYLFVPISWMFKKQTSVSHSSTESEIISLDAGLRLDGIPALDLWDSIVPISWMCNKQTAVSHSSTESEIISLDTGLRLDGLLALELWDLIVSVLGNVSRVSDGSGQPDNDVHKRHKSQKKIDVMEDIDSVPSNVQSARKEALLYVFEDNEAVIKMF